MSRLQYRLPIGTDPRGRQKIYFCCHPDDFDTYFDVICKDIFAKEENCVIFYESNSDEDYDREELLFQLAEMQLFVVPVTEKLLTKKSRALELEIPFALGKITAADKICHHIAVLPILIGSGLSDLFNRTEPFVGLQYLERYPQDTTALSYEEKLERYLRSVIISNDEDKKIRSEFRADIFLSYRKIDRVLARKLMKKIHGRTLCRDVSIWYDEYLVPGENWEDAINNALASSDLFVLNVTPRLLEANNYVLEKEYPNAMSSGKPVLPVITEDTDIEQLKLKYDQIERQLIEDKDSDLLEKGLIWGLVSRAGKKELLTPDDRSGHLYYIGLAYKNSVGVEADSERALDLLKDAGEKGSRKAYLTLGRMFEYGDGVIRNEAQAIEYYSRFIELQKPDFGTSKDGDLDLLLAYDAIGMMHIGNSRLNDAFDIYLELNELIDHMTSCYGSFKQINLPISYERLGNIKKAMGDPEAAQEYYKKAMNVRMHPPVTTNIATEADRAAEADAAGYNERHMKMGLAVNLYSIGELCLTNRDLAGAKANLKEANRMLTELAAAQEDRDLLLNLGKSHVRLADVFEAEGDIEKAQEHYEKALEKLNNICRNQKDHEAKAMHTVAKISLAGLYRDIGRLQRAYVLTGESVAEAEKLVKEDGHPRMRGLLATAYERMGTIEEMLGNRDLALLYYRKNLELSEKLVLETEDTEFKRALAIAYEKIAKTLSRDDENRTDADLTAAVEYLLKDLEITRLLAKNEADIQGQRDLSVCYDALYNTYLYLNAEKALEYGVRGLQIAYRLAEKINEPKEIYELGISYYSVGRLCADINPLCFNMAMKLWSAAYRHTSSSEIAEKIGMLRKLMGVPYAEFSLGPGYCSGLNELACKWPEGETGKSDFEKIAWMTKSQQGTDAVNSSRTFGNKLWLVIALVVIVCAVLQITRVFDVIGLVRDKLGKGGTIVLIAALAIAYFVSFKNRGKSS